MKSGRDDPEQGGSSAQGSRTVPPAAEPASGTRLRRGAYRTKRELAYAALREAIQGSRLRPGTRLVISRLARELGLSEVPVREALFQLQAEGLVVSEPHVGATVAEIRAADVLDVYRLSAVAEGAAAGWAVPLLTQQDFQELERSLEAMDAAVVGGNLEAFSQHDGEFHRALYARCPSPRLLALIEDLWGTKERLRTAFPVRARGAESQREHRALMAAVRDGEAPTVERLVREHLTTAGRNRSAAVERMSAASEETEPTPPDPLSC